MPAAAGRTRIAQLRGGTRRHRPHRRTAITVGLPGGIDASRCRRSTRSTTTYYFKPDAGRLLASPADETPCEPADVQPEEIDVAYAAHYLQEATTLTIGRIASSWAGHAQLLRRPAAVDRSGDDNPAFSGLPDRAGYGILTSPALGRLAAHLLTRPCPLAGPCPRGRRARRRFPATLGRRTAGGRRPPFLPAGPLLSLEQVPK